MQSSAARWRRRKAIGIRQADRPKEIARHGLKEAQEIQPQITPITPIEKRSSMGNQRKNGLIRVIRAIRGSQIGSTRM
jgi:hypothetical protein